MKRNKSELKTRCEKAISRQQEKELRKKDVSYTQNVE